jgi:hypothetical protein
VVGKAKLCFLQVKLRWCLVTQVQVQRMQSMQESVSRTGPDYRWRLGHHGKIIVEPELA